MDNLEKDVAAAMRLGYGVHYGRYKADHPNTKEDAGEDPGNRKCRNCGEPIRATGLRNRRLYCDDRCRKAYNYKMAQQKRMEQTNKEESL